MSTERSTSNLLLPLRATQIVLAIIILGLTGYGKSFLPAYSSQCVSRTSITSGSIKANS
jgi:hypothetical protein